MGQALDCNRVQHQDSRRDSRLSLRERRLSRRLSRQSVFSAYASERTIVLLRLEFHNESIVNRIIVVLSPKSLY